MFASRPHIRWLFLIVSVFSGLFTVISTVHAATTGCSKPLTVGTVIYPTEKSEVSSPAPYTIHRMTIRKILTSAGCDFQLINMPWKRSLSALKHGQLDALYNSSYTEERYSYAYYSIPYAEEKIGLVMRLEDIPHFNPTSFKDIVNSNLDIAIRPGVWYGKSFANAYKNNGVFRKKVLPASPNSPWEKWLISKRVDIYFNETVAARYRIEQNKLKNTLGLHPLNLHSNNVHITFSRKSVPLSDVTTVNQAIIRYNAQRDRADLSVDEHPD